MKHPLIAWLKARGETQKAFCQRVGISEMTLYRLVKGTGHVTSDILETVSGGTDQDVSEAVLIEAWKVNKELKVQAEKTAT